MVGSVLKALERSKYVLCILWVLLVLGGCAFGRHMDKGDAAFASRDYETALKEYSAAAKLDPESPEARDKVLLTREKLTHRITIRRSKS